MLRASPFPTQASGVQVLSHLLLVLHGHLLRRHLNAPMVRAIVAQHQIFQHRHVLQRVLDGEVAVHALFQRTIEPFDDAGFGITAGRKVINVFAFHQGLKGLVVEFLPVVRLQTTRCSSLSQDLLEGCRHGLAGLGLDRFHPRVLGQHVHHRQQVPVAGCERRSCPFLYSTS